MPRFDPHHRSRRLVAATLLLGCTPLCAQVTFPVEFDATASGLNETERAYLTSHLQEAGRLWVAPLEIGGARSIEVLVAIDDTILYSNGASVTTAFVGTVGGRDTFEQGAAHELRTGTDPNGATPDIRININTTYLRNELWFDPNPVFRVFPVPQDRTDAMSVMLHELGHALAYNGWADGQGVPPPTFWSTFDQWIAPGAPSLFMGPAVVAHWGTVPDLTTGNIHHWANASALPRSKRAAHPPIVFVNGAPVPMHGCDGPVPMDVSSAHARGNLPPGLVYELMNGVVFYRGSRYDISALDIAALRDAGLPVLRVFGSGFED
jgi:hypothetical protein